MLDFAVYLLFLAFYCSLILCNNGVTDTCLLKATCLDLF